MASLPHSVPTSLRPYLTPSLLHSVPTSLRLNTSLKYQDAKDAKSTNKQIRLTHEQINVDVTVHVSVPTKRPLRISKYCSHEDVILSLKLHQL